MEEVAAFLERLGLNSLVPSFRENVSRSPRPPSEARARLAPRPASTPHSTPAHAYSRGKLLAITGGPPARSRLSAGGGRERPAVAD